MVQNVSNSVQSQNGFGTINRIGTTNNDRVVYLVTDGLNKESLKMSVAQKDADAFEKSYQSIIESAPKLQHYMETTPPEKIQKRQKSAKWVVAGSGLVAGLIPLIACKPQGVWKWLGTIALTAASTAAGLFGGSLVASKMITPPGAKEFATATQTLSKLDIKPLEG